MIKRKRKMIIGSDYLLKNDYNQGVSDNSEGNRFYRIFVPGKVLFRSNTIERQGKVT